MRVKCLLDLMHDTNGIQTKFFYQALLLSESNSVLALSSYQHLFPL